MKNKKSLLVVILLLTTLLTGLISIPIAFADDGDFWWNHDWIWRIPITITGTTVGAMSNYPVSIDLKAVVGTSSDNTIYLGGTIFQADYGDIRFVDSNHAPIDYWQVDNYTWSYPNTTFWVEVPTIPASPDTVNIWMYWGNAAVDTTSNGDDVFPFFDDFDTDEDVGDWTNQSGGSAAIVFDWRLEVEAHSMAGGWSALECADRQTLVGGSSVYGWSMEWDQNIRTYDITSGASFCGAALSNNWGHDAGAEAEDNILNGTSIYYRDQATWANRYVRYREWDDGEILIGPLQTNQTQFDFEAWGWLDTTKGLIPVEHWTYMQLVQFDDYGYVKFNDTMLRELDLLWEHNSLYQGPTFSSKSWPGNGDYIRIGANWVFMRPIADPEPTALAGEVEGVLVDIGIHNYVNVTDDRWVFEGRTQYLFYVNLSVVGDVGSYLSVGMGFYDFAGNFYSFYYDNVTRRVTITSPDDGVSASVQGIETGGEWVYINFTVMFNSPVVDTMDIDIYLRWDIPTIGDSGWYSASPEYFNIYNLGGYVSTVATGPSGRKEGGDVFELYASRGGRVRSNITFKNLQHVGFLFEMSFPTWSEFGPGSFGYIEYGMDFNIEGVWYEGLVVRLEPWDMDVDATNAWVEYYVSFYYNGVFVGDEPINIIALWEAGTAFTTEKQVARIWVDLWFNKMNSSTVMGASVNSYWYGMRKDITWWDPFTWFAGWTPLVTNYTRASWFQDLELDDGIHSCTEITLMNAWCEVYHADLEHEDFNLSAINYDVFNFEIEEGSMRGIDTPIFTDTKIFEKANQGFFAALMAGVIAGFERVQEAGWTFLMTAWTYFIPIMDAIPAFFGFNDFTDTILGVVQGAYEYVFTLITEAYIFQMIGSIFTIVTNTFGHIIYWFTAVISMFNQIFTIVWSIWDGTYTITTGLGNIWTLIAWNSWVEAVPLFIIIAWLVRLTDADDKGKFIETFFGDIGIMIMLLGFFLNIATFVIDMTVGMTLRIMNFVRG